MSTIKANYYQLNNGTAIDIPIQTQTKVWDSNSGQLSWSGNYDWQAWTASDFAVTSRAQNSRWLVTATFPIAARSNSGVSTDIWYKIGAGSYTTLSGQGTTGGYEAGSLGIGTTWFQGSTDIWQANTIVASGVITAAAGSVITFRIYGRNGGPGTDVQAANQMLGHPAYNAVFTAQEIKIA